MLTSQLRDKDREATDHQKQLQPKIEKKENIFFEQTMKNSEVKTPCENYSSEKNWCFSTRRFDQYML